MSLAYGNLIGPAEGPFSVPSLDVWNRPHGKTSTVVFYQDENKITVTLSLTARIEDIGVDEIEILTFERNTSVHRNARRREIIKVDSGYLTPNTSYQHSVDMANEAYHNLMNSGYRITKSEINW